MAAEIALTLADDARLRLLEWKQCANQRNKNVEFFVGVDIGATNTRVSLASPTETLSLFKFKAKSTRIVIKKVYELSEIIADLWGPDVLAKGSAIGLAGRIIEGGQKAEITNFEGGKEHMQITKRELPKNIFPASRTAFLNDLESACYGINALGTNGDLVNHFQSLFSNSTEEVALKPQNYAVLSMGTGLGSALLVSFHGSSEFKVVALEASHTMISPLGADNTDSARERQLLEFISEKLYNKKHWPEWEDICSGRGVSYVYEWLTGEKLLPEEVAIKSTIEGSPAAEAMLIHYRYFARFSQMLAIATQIKGIFWIGDNQVTNDAFIRQQVAHLEREFHNHTKPEWLVNIQLFSQTKQLNMAVLGTVFYARNLASSIGDNLSTPS